MESVQHVYKIQYVYLLEKNIKRGVWRVAVCLSLYIGRTVPKG
jgi:hypothetical protein